MKYLDNHRKTIINPRSRSKLPMTKQIANNIINKHKIASIVSVVTVLGILAFTFGIYPSVKTASADHDPFNGVPQTSVTICHVTGNGGYVQNSPNISATGGDIDLTGGHTGHGDNSSGDIIPPFHFDDSGDILSYPGKNWTASTEDIWNNGGCDGDGETEDNTGNLTVTKVVEGGDAQVSDFTLLVDETVVINGEANDFAADDYVVSETGGPGNYAGEFSGDCDENGNITIVAGEDYDCTLTNTFQIEPPPIPSPVTIKAYKVVCQTEADLPNWGAGDVEGKPVMIDNSTASDFVAASNGQCWLEDDWAFQYGFAEKDNTSGVHKLPGDFVGEADGTDTTGQCDATHCGPNTNTGTGYADWKTFDSETSDSGATPAQVEISDLESAPGIWVREVLQNGYIPFTYPPDAPPGGMVSAEMYCHTDILNFDNFDQIFNPELGNTYYCVAFNAPVEEAEGGGGEGEPETFTLTVHLTGEGSGKVTDDDPPVNINCQTDSEADCVFTYDSGTAVTLTATPDSDSTFEDTWFGDCTGNDPVCNLVMNANKIATAHFSLLPDVGGGGSSSSSSSSSSGGGGGGATGIPFNQPQGQTLGVTTPSPTPVPQILGETLPRTGQSAVNILWLMAILIAALFVPKSKVTTRVVKLR